MNFLIKHTSIIIVILLLQLYSNQSVCQNNFRVMFYNVENLFDTHNNTNIRDAEFTPDGTRRWNNYKYWQKIKKIAKVIKMIGEWDSPAIVGLAEIENDTVINNLIYTDVLKKYKYKFIQRNSPDRRGIDVAFLYRPDKYFPIETKFYPLKNEKGQIMYSREILYTKGIVKGGDTLHFIVVHFPSRYGGYKKSEPKRIRAVNQLLNITDSINRVESNPNIIIMGDFNDTYKNKSIKILETNKYLSRLTYEDRNMGSHKYRGKWSTIDYFFASNRLIDNRSGVYINDKRANIYNNEVLLEEDKKYLGKKPFRTYIGFRYNGGFSDHLPVYIDIHLKK